MPDLPLVRACAVVLLSTGCGEDLTLADGALLVVDEALTISGQVLDGAGRPLWGVEVTATDQRTNVAPVDYFGLDDLGAVPRSGSDVHGEYTIELDHLGPTWLHFGEYGRTFAWLEVDAGTDTEVDVVLAEDDVVHCRLLDDEDRPISSYSMWATGSHFGFGRGGGCFSSHGSCGPEALTFVWPSGYDRVQVRIGDSDIELSDWRDPCEAIE